MSASPTSGRGTAPAGLFGVDAAVHTRLRERLAQAVRGARDSGRSVLAATTVPVGERLDPAAIAWASRRAGERWFCLEQPERDGFALAALGAVHTLESRGPDRFAEIAAAWRGLAANALHDAADGPRGAGLVAVGGFALAPDGGSGPHLARFAPATLG